MLSLFIQGAALGFTAALSPGTFQAYMINQSLTGGFRRGALVALSPLLSDPPIVITILLVLDRLPPKFLGWISLMGGAFAIFLALNAASQWIKSKNAKIIQKKPEVVDLLVTDQYTKLDDLHLQSDTAGRENVFFRGALMNLLSPGPYTFWTLVLGPIVLNALDQSTSLAISFLVGFYLIFIGGMVAIVALFHQARRLGSQVVHALSLGSVLILAIFGIFLLIRGASIIFDA